MEAWQAAERIFTELRSLSPLTTLLGRAFAASYASAERIAEEEVQFGFFAVMLAGYATRTVFVEAIGQPLLDPRTVPLESLDGRGFDPQDASGNAEVLRLLADPVWHVVFSDFGAVMSLPPEFWAGYISLATVQLQRNLKSRAVRTRHLGKERVEGMLRYGYVLRCLDEALGGEPEPREALPTSALARVRWKVLSERPLSALSDDELAQVLLKGSTRVLEDLKDLEPAEELTPQLAAGPIAVLGMETWESWEATDRDLAVMTTQAGFRVRMTELQLFPDATDYKTRDWIPVLEVVIKMTDREAEGSQSGDESTAPTEAWRAIVSSAHLFASTPETTNALLVLVPGTSSSVRSKTFDRWLAIIAEKGATPAGLDSDTLRRLMVFGYAVCVARELVAAGERATQGTDDGTPG